MKPELAVLSMDVWADVFVYPWINRQKLARIVHKFKERAFAEKLQTFLHDAKCGKHSLRYLIVCYKLSDKPKKNLTNYQMQKRKTPQYQTSLVIAPPLAYGMRHVYKDCEFPESEMPENINSFKRLTIRHLDDEVLDFLDKIKPLFTDVFLGISYLSFTTKPAKNVHILFGHLLPMLASIRKICCSSECIEFLEQHFKGTLALIRELDLYKAEVASIPAYLNWLCTPQDFHVHGPRFLQTFAKSDTIFAIVDAVRKQFLASNASSTFVIFLKFHYDELQSRTEEFNLENATTKERLVVRNASLKKPLIVGEVNYVEILRHPKGADDAVAIMRNWIKEHAFKPDDEGKQICIEHPIIGRITKKKKGGKMNQDEDGSDDDDQEKAGPSTSAKIMKK